MTTPLPCGCVLDVHDHRAQECAECQKFGIGQMILTKALTLCPEGERLSFAYSGGPKPQTDAEHLENLNARRDLMQHHGRGDEEPWAKAYRSQLEAVAA